VLNQSIDGGDERGGGEGEDVGACVWMEGRRERREIASRIGEPRTWDPATRTINHLQDKDSNLIVPTHPRRRWSSYEGEHSRQSPRYESPWHPFACLLPFPRSEKQDVLNRGSSFGTSHTCIYLSIDSLPLPVESSVESLPWSLDDALHTWVSTTAAGEGRSSDVVQLVPIELTMDLGHLSRCNRRCSPSSLPISRTHRMCACNELRPATCSDPPLTSLPQTAVRAEDVLDVRRLFVSCKRALLHHFHKCTVALGEDGRPALSTTSFPSLETDLQSRYLQR
jgi:hypothetical protein